MLLERVELAYLDQSIRKDGSGRHFAGFGLCGLGSCGLGAGLRASSQIPNLSTNPELTKCQTNLCIDYCKSLPTHGRNTATSVLFILFLFLSRCHFPETIAIRASLAGFGLCGRGTNRFRTADSRAPARLESIPKPSLTTPDSLRSPSRDRPEPCLSHLSILPDDGRVDRPTNSWTL